MHTSSLHVPIPEQHYDYQNTMTSNPLLSLAFGSALLLAILSISSSTNAWYSSSAHLEENNITLVLMDTKLHTQYHWTNLCASSSLSYCTLAKSALIFLSLIWMT